MKQVRIAAALLAPLLILACSGPGGQPTKSDAGLAIGAVAGGIIGNQVGKGTGRVVATAVGAVIGGIVGSEIGRALDEHDRRAAAYAEYTALEKGRSGVATPWRNPDSGHYGMVVPGRPYKMRDRDCRDYTHTIYIDGRPQTMRGTACRNADGTWRNVS